MLPFFPLYLFILSCPIQEPDGEGDGGGSLGRVPKSLPFNRTYSCQSHEVVIWHVRFSSNFVITAPALCSLPVGGCPLGSLHAEPRLTPSVNLV